MRPAKAVFELGLNHLGDVTRARRMIDVLRDQGATHATIQVVVNPLAMTRNPNAIESLQKNCMSLEDNLAVVKHARNVGLDMGATVIDPGDVAALVQAGVGFFKILSSDLSFEPLHHAVAATDLPFYLSVGASSLDEITRVVKSIRRQSPGAVIRLIHTVLQVPTPAPQLNLANIPWLAEQVRVPVAYGQHSDIMDALWTAVAVGAETVFVYVADEPSPNLPDGPHAVACAKVNELLNGIDLVRTMLGCPERILTAADEQIRPAIRRSIVAARPIAAGEILTAEALAFLRPGTGRQPWDLREVVGLRAERAYQAGEDIKCPLPNDRDE